MHHMLAAKWFADLPEDVRLCFCRVTQLSFLRLLTTEAVVQVDVMSQAEAWQAYDIWLDDPRIVFINEPEGLERSFRARSGFKRPAPKDWADAYLIAFSLVADLRLVTFDRAFRGKITELVLLGP